MGSRSMHVGFLGRSDADINLCRKGPSGAVRRYTSGAKIGVVRMEKMQ